MSSMYTAEFGPNVEMILSKGFRIIDGKVPAQVRKELRAAVKAKVLGHVRKDGLLPEVFFNPNNKMSALETRKRQAEYAISCIAKVMARPEDYSLARQAIEEKLFGQS